MYQLQQQIRDKDITGFEQNLRLLFAHIPTSPPALSKREGAVKNEAYYHSMLLLLMKMLGFEIQGQAMTNIGRIDAVWHQPGLTVVAEIKYSSKKKAGSLLDEALAQIRDRRYYEKYLDREVILLGVAFSGKEIKCRTEEIT
jgi:hypothetical protein